MKIKEEHLINEIPIMCASLSSIEFLFDIVLDNSKCLKAKNIDKMYRMKYKIHGLIQDIEDEMVFGETRHHSTKLTNGLNQVQKEILKTQMELFKGEFS